MLESLLEAASTMRAELLMCRYGWIFSGDNSLSSWKNPILSYSPLVWAENVGGKRDTEVKQIVDVSCQFLVQISHTDRQVKHKPKVDIGFVRHVETPLFVGLPLTIHQRVRDTKPITCAL